MRRLPLSLMRRLRLFLGKLPNEMGPIRCTLRIGLGLRAILVALSVPAAAQPPQNIPRIGYLASHPDDMELQPFFLQGLRELGYAEGKNIVIEQRHAVEGQHAKIRELAAELVRLKVD